MHQSSEFEYREVVSESPSSQGHKKSRRADAAKRSTATSDELSNRYEALSREHESVRSELQAKLRRLEEKDHRIRSLKADITDLQRKNEEQATALALARHELRSCHSQLDNVQRFISTADAHADQDIIQKAQELNEEVYQISMMMADYVAEGFVRQSEMPRRMEEHISVGESVLATVGQVVVNHLAALVGDEDVALFLQIAFQCYLSHMLCHVLSSWTVDLRLSALIEETYQRLRRAGEIIQCSSPIPAN